MSAIKKWLFWPLFWIFLICVGIVGYFLVGGTIGNAIGDFLGYPNIRNAQGNLWIYYLAAFVGMGMIGLIFTARELLSRTPKRTSRVSLFLVLPALSVLLFSPFFWSYASRQDSIQASFEQEVSNAKMSVQGIRAVILSTSSTPLSDARVQLVHRIRVTNETGRPLTSVGLSGITRLRNGVTYCDAYSEFFPASTGNILAGDTTVSGVSRGIDFDVLSLSAQSEIAGLTTDTFTIARDIPNGSSIEVSATVKFFVPDCYSEDGLDDVEFEIAPIVAD